MMVEVVELGELDPVLAVVRPLEDHALGLEGALDQPGRDGIVLNDQRAHRLLQ